jgi:hypothetical protein
MMSDYKQKSWKLVVKYAESNIKSDCPLQEDEGVLWASSRIAELEKERDEFKAIAFSITPEIIDFVRCGIGANYGGSCYTEKMEKTYAPILASFKALKEQG